MIIDGGLSGVSAFRNCDKMIRNLGVWRSGKKMPKTAFPLTASRSYSLGAPWTWRVVQIEADGATYRILIAFRTDRREFRAMLGRMREDGLTEVLCRVEHHGSHGGWHVHYQHQSPWAAVATCGPAFRQRNCGAKPLTSDLPIDFPAWAMSVGMDLFNLPHGDGAALI